MSNKECDIVQDLLPLYYDKACSEASCSFVEKHMAGCSDCQKIYNELQENNVDEVLAKESKGVLERHAKKERNAAYKAGVVIAAILLLPIVITFIVQLATGMGLGVFSVVTASMMLVAALTVVPLMSTNNRLLKCIFAGVTSLMLILFFVDRMNGGGNFLLWAIPTVFGISIVLFPIVICLVKLPPVLSDKKALNNDMGYFVAVSYNVYSVLSFRDGRNQGRIYCCHCTYDWRVGSIPCNQISSGSWTDESRN